jgi:hypothetical protein
VRLDSPAVAVEMLFSPTKEQAMKIKTKVRGGPRCGSGGLTSGGAIP